MLTLARSFLFYVGLVISTVLWGTFGVVTGLFFPYRKRYYVIGVWTRFVLWWLQITCNIRTHIEGREHLREGPGILVFKHQSTWDALFSQTLAKPTATVIKKSLLLIPFFGWAFWVTNPIAIDRAKKVASIRQLVKIGKQKYEEGYWITLFPEGARVEKGKIGRFHAGAGALAYATKAPLFVVAHNGGHCWPRKGLAKHAGVVTVKISPPLRPGDMKTQEINQCAEAWLHQAMIGIDPSYTASDVQTG